MVLFLYDIIIFSKTEEEHREYSDLAKRMISKERLILYDKKCEYIKKEIKVLSHHSNQDGIKTTKL